MSIDNTGQVHSDNKGARALREKYPDRGGIKVVADLVGADPSAVSRWFSGERRPDTKQRASLEDKTGVGWRLFDEEVEAGEPAA